MPYRLYFDSNILRNIRWMLKDETFANGFYDYKSDKFLRIGKENPALQQDVVALRYLVDKDDEFALQFVGSGLVLQEQPIVGFELEQLQRHFASYQVENLGEAELPPKISEANLATLSETLEVLLLPHRGKAMDIELLVDSLRQRCHAFLTVDYDTIWRFKRHLAGLGINVRRPSEMIGSLGEFLAPEESG